jgi:O-6-methylguanine DNA methyltransferase
MEKTEAIKKLNTYGLTEFQKRVLIETMKIPLGEVRTYKEIAKAAGNPVAYRAVGSTLRNNPLTITIPCHRVIRSDGDLGNYSAPGGKKKKEKLLRKEGAI